MQRTTVWVWVLLSFWFTFKDMAQWFIYLHKQQCVYVPQILLYFKNNFLGEFFAPSAELYLGTYQFQGDFCWKKILGAKWNPEF